MRSALGDRRYAKCSRVEPCPEQDDLNDAVGECIGKNVVDKARPKPNAVPKERQIEISLCSFFGVGPCCEEEVRIRILKEALGHWACSLLGTHHGDRERRIRRSQHRAKHFASAAWVSPPASAGTSSTGVT